MIPGRFHAETFAPFDIEPGETVVLPLVDQDGRPALSFVLPIDDTDFEYEISDVSFDPIATNRPTRIIVDPYRLGKPGTGDDDRTGRSVRAVTPPYHQHGSNVSVKKDPSGVASVASAVTSGAPGTSTWADTFGKHEFVNEDDGPFQIRMSHNAKARIRVGKVVFHATNQDAKDIWRKGGWLMYSDGLVRRENGDPGR